MIHLDLFSGIGGFSIASDEVFENVEHIFCEINPFCQQVLKKHWPQATIYADIKQLDTTTIGHVDLLTGGFPCQPFSVAGKQKGKDDDRFLWPEMLRIIKECKPTWIVGENVAGIINMALEQVCSDLEGAGYEVQPIIIPACAVNAPHRRDRVWVIAYAKSEQDRRVQQPWIQRYTGTTNSEIAANTSDERLERSNQPEENAREDNSGEKGAHGVSRQFRELQHKRLPHTITDPTGILLQRQHLRSQQGQFRRESWSKNWLEVAQQFCGVDDGLPVELDGFKLSKSKHRNERIKALGNAIVPQIAIEIMKAILNTPANSGEE